MTAEVPFSRPHRAAAAPGDARRAPRELMTMPGMVHDERAWKLVWIRVGGAWRSGVLTVWRRPPNSTVWVAHVRWGEGDHWGWFLYDPATIRPAPEPPPVAAGRAPTGAGRP
ncbi:hypothetical protein [Kitasatospora sp. NPDC050543]|uniref:hypothetical protein n=1 Tax=Kitasatospora sp. NPDC050543 TaxID=3364054 RepID=UPI0037B24548